MSDIPFTMQAAQVITPGKGFTLVEIPVPTPGKGQVLIKIEAASLCHSDAAVVEGYFPGVQYPRIPGHEIIGRIAALGPDVNDRFKIGSRVGVGWHGRHCFFCNSCRAGNFFACTKAQVTGIDFDGGFAEYTVVGVEVLAFIPEEFDAAEAAPLLCAGITVFNGIRKNGRIGPGDLVAVVGIGGLGSLAIQFATKFGARVAAISSSASKEGLCLEAGVRKGDFIDSSKEDPVQKLKSMGGAKCVVILAPNAEEAAKYTAALSWDGTVLILAILPKPLATNTLDLVVTSSRVQGHPSGTGWDCEECCNFALLQNIRPVVEKFKLSEIGTAYKKMMDGTVRFRSVIVFGGAERS